MRSTERLLSLTEGQRRIEIRLEKLEGIQQRVLEDLSQLKEWALESRFRTRAPLILQRWLREVTLIEPAALTLIETALEAGAMTDQDWELLESLDVVLHGTVRDNAESKVLLAVGVAAVIDNDLIGWATQTAALLQRVGYTTAVGGVAGIIIRPDAEELARSQGVVVMREGRVLCWPEPVERQV